MGFNPRKYGKGRWHQPVNEQINELATWLLQQYGIAPELDLDEKLEKIV